ncbi:acetyl-CoA carboxylase biotin carboxyl carrier protein [Streptomyces sp. SCUT-3]|nr:acetyl-CoA carboxylase biotin carboxyl carrier protein [Streptomyces sp. SCUT-3]
MGEIVAADPVQHANVQHASGQQQANGQAPPSQAALDSVCRSVTELARTAPEPPSRIRLQHGQTTVEMEWPGPAPVPAPAAAAVAAAAAPAAAAVAAGPAPEAAPAAQDRLRYVCAPMVGTFYHAREPEAPPFVSVGDLVRPGQPVGILEVMKMMSTVEADVAGRVVEVVAPNGQPVEFQQRLLAVEPLSDDEADDRR